MPTIEVCSNCNGFMLRHPDSPNAGKAMECQECFTIADTTTRTLAEVNA